MNTIPCITDSDEFRYEPDEPDTDPRTDAEKRIEWLCHEWETALVEDTYETWRDVRMMAYGATQALRLNLCRSEAITDRILYSDIGSLAFDNSIDCIRAGKYEGAK